MKRYSIVFDNKCAVCKTGVKALQSIGFMDLDQGIELDQFHVNSLACNVDPERACDEMAVIDNESLDVSYGYDGYVNLLEVRHKKISKLLSKNLVKLFINPFYLFLASNRRVIAPIQPSSTTCSPKLKKPYRIAFLTLVALDRKLRKTEYASKVDLRKYLDLVALATICDVVPLKYLNRAFVSTGLKVMGLRNNPGLKALFDLANIQEIPNEQNLGYIIGPRINAACRLGNSKLGVELLCADSEVVANELAEKLNNLNEERKDIQNKVLESALEKLDKIDLKSKNVIVLADANWHEGVIGIIAGRIKDRFHKPTIIISINKEGIGTVSYTHLTLPTKA